MSTAHKSTEFTASIVSALLALFLPLTPLWPSVLEMRVIALSLVMAALILARGVAKRYRGLTHAGYTASEFYMWALNPIAVCALVFNGHRSASLLLPLIVPAMCYSLSRGNTKALIARHSAQISL